MRDFFSLLHTMSLFNLHGLVSFKSLVISQTLLVLLRGNFFVNGNCNDIIRPHLEEGRMEVFALAVPK